MAVVSSSEMESLKIGPLLVWEAMQSFLEWAKFLELLSDQTCRYLWCHLNFQRESKNSQVVSKVWRYGKPCDIIKSPFPYPGSNEGSNLWTLRDLRSWGSTGCFFVLFFSFLHHVSLATNCGRLKLLSFWQPPFHNKDESNCSVFSRLQWNH